MHMFSTHASLSSREPLSYGMGATPFGPGLIVWSPKGIVMLHLQQPGEPECAHIIAASFPDNPLEHMDREAQPLLEQAFKQRCPFLLLGTPFQLKVWQGLLEIPLGQVRTYGALASSLGHPGAARAVGTAIAANKLAFVVPCHRVVRASGESGQYRWGADQKTRILAWEAQQLADSNADR